MTDTEQPDTIEDPAAPANLHPANPAPATPPSPLWRWVTIGVLILGVVLTALFALRATRSFRTFHNERGRPPREATGDIAPWMTIPYVAHAYGVPESYLYEQLGIDPQGNERNSLIQIERTHFNGERGLLRDRIMTALELYYAGSAIPTPVMPDPADVPMPEQPPLPGEGNPNLRGGPDGPRSGEGGPPPPEPPTLAPPAGAGGAP